MTATLQCVENTLGDDMGTLYITVGIPASGKTTWAEAFVVENYCVNINRDDIREQLFGIPYTFSKANEKAVTERQVNLAILAEREGKDIIISDTNLNKKTREFWIEWAEAHVYEVVIKEFEITPTLALRYNRLRARPVPEHVIHDMFDKWMTYKQYQRYVPDTLNPHCVIFDIDGTLAHMKGRNPYQWTEVRKDEVDHIVAELADLYKVAGYDIVVLSGRDEVCREETIEWLNSYDIPFDALHMRPQGDRRPDYEVKHELLLTKVAPDYNVQLCVDDRDQVVRLWRWHGIKCFQVQEGRF